MVFQNLFCSGVRRRRKNSTEIRLIRKFSVRIIWHDPMEMLTSSQSFLSIPLLSASHQTAFPLNDFSIWSFIMTFLLTWFLENLMQTYCSVFSDIRKCDTLKKKKWRFVHISFFFFFFFLFNGISTFVGYLSPNAPCRVLREDEEVRTYPNVNIKTRLEFELAYSIYTDAHQKNTSSRRVRPF